MDNILVRDYKDDDFEVVRELIFDTFNHEKVKRKGDDNHIELVCLYEDRIVGYILLTRYEDYITGEIKCRIDDFCVNKDCRGHGIGNILLDATIDRARVLKAKYIELTSGIQRESARHLYQKKGFKIRESNIFRKML